MQKKGILKVVAKTGGIKIDNGDWINPTKEAKGYILSKLDELRKLLGKEVIVELSNEGYYSSLVLNVEHKDLKKSSAHGDERLRSMAVSYAKDLVVGKIIELDDLEKTADRFITYVLE